MLEPPNPYQGMHYCKHLLDARDVGEAMRQVHELHRSLAQPHRQLLVEELGIGQAMCRLWILAKHVELLQAQAICLQGKRKNKKKHTHKHIHTDRTWARCVWFPFLRACVRACMHARAFRALLSTSIMYVTVHQGFEFFFFASVLELISNQPTDGAIHVHGDGGTSVRCFHF